LYPISSHAKTITLGIKHFYDNYIKYRECLNILPTNRTVLFTDAYHQIVF
jgi:hypothetical protein